MSTFLFFLFLLPAADSLSFQITRFDPDRTNMIYEGDAEPSVGVVEFNSRTYQYQVGRVSYAERVPLWNAKTREQADFSTRFSFVITQTSASHAAGLAFFLVPVGFGIPSNSGGGFLGLFNTTTSDSSQNQIVLVEFDTFPNPEWDPSFEHVGINVNSISSAKNTFWNSSLHNKDTVEALIAYNATTKNLSVSWTYSNTSNSIENSSLSHQIDLMEILPEWVTIGFSAATSSFIERHQLLMWEFNSSLVVKETNGKDEKRTRLIVILVVSLGVLTVGVLIALGILWRQREKRMKRKATETAVNLTSINDDLERGAGPRKFSYDNLALATSNFSDERKLGQGGFGAVYKGCLHDTEIATGRKSSDPVGRSSEMGIVAWIWDLYGSGNLLSAIDEKLYKAFDVEQVKCLMIVGLWCAHPDCKLRPSIRQAMQVLHFEAAMPNLPSKMPVPVYYVPTIPSKFIRAFSTIHPPTNSHQHTASIIAQVLRYSRVEFLKNIPLLLSSLNSHVIQLVFSNPRLRLRSCLDFFNFLRENPVNKPELVAHLTLFHILYDLGKFTDVQFVLNCIASDVNLRTSVLNIVFLVEDGTDDDHIFVQRLSGMLFSVYADNEMFEEAIGVFDYMENIGFKIHERCCIVLLLALNRCDKMDMSFSFFRKMVGTNVEITIFSMNIMMDGLCKRGEVEKAKDLMEEMVTRGIEPDIVTYNTLINVYYINGMVDEALKVKSTMEYRGFGPDVVTYNTIASGLRKVKRFGEAKSWLFTI
ncbi:hypothetical protein Q3G72_031719 [Acer saccharum]|nr:hypothetical protein Q3G72_031719 [Acer saccharum]